MRAISSADGSPYSFSHLLSSLFVGQRAIKGERMPKVAGLR